MLAGNGNPNFGDTNQPQLVPIRFLISQCWESGNPILAIVPIGSPILAISPIRSPILAILPINFGNNPDSCETFLLMLPIGNPISVMLPIGSPFLAMLLIGSLIS